MLSSRTKCSPDDVAGRYAMHSSARFRAISCKYRLAANVVLVRAERMYVDAQNCTSSVARDKLRLSPAVSRFPDAVSMHYVTLRNV